MKPGLVTFWNSAAKPEMRPVIFLSPSIEMYMTVSFHDGHRTPKSFAAVAKITAVKYL